MAAIAPISLDEPAAYDGSTLVSLIAGFTAADPERAVLSAEEARLVRDAAARLAARDRQSSRRPRQR